ASGLSPASISRSPGPEDRVTTPRSTTGVAAMIPAHQRQRGDGRCPVGVSSRVKPLQAIATTMVAGTYRATRPAAGAAWATPELVGARGTRAALNANPKAS